MLMWRLCVCIIALSAGPTHARSTGYDDDSEPRQLSESRDHSETRGFHEGHGHKQHHRHGLTSQLTDPSRIGPAPAGYWYRCDEPAGYYPYISACQTPWRTVPSTPFR